jgi:hypothetical protein
VSTIKSETIIKKQKHDEAKYWEDQVKDFLAPANSYDGFKRMHNLKGNAMKGEDSKTRD